MPALHNSARRAVVDRVDSFVLERMRTLVERATRLSGRRVGDVTDVLVAGLAALRGRDQAVDLPPDAQQAMVDEFHRLFYHSPGTTWQVSTYRGVTTWKNSGWTPCTDCRRSE